MGKVFNAESVAREAVPWPGDQERVAREFMDTATNIQGLDAAIIFGSTALGNANRRSDIDVAVAYNDKGDLPAFFTELRDTVQSFPQGELIEPFVVGNQSLTDAKTALQGDVFMAEHLRLAARESDLPGINADAFATMPDMLTELPPAQAASLAEQVATTYITNKVRKFFNASRQNDTSNYRRLQRAFELPTALTRKLVRLQTIRSQYHNQAFQAQFYDRDNLAHESQQLSESLGNEWTQCSTWLIEKDQEYSQLLENTLEGSVSISAYQKWLEDVARPSFDHALRLSVAALAIRNNAND